jgi:DNA-binding transcriptional MerR regulator
MPRKRRLQAARSGQGSITEVLIPEKHYFRIGEVSDLTETKTYVLRFWETEFPMLKPVKSPTGHRLYRREDVQTVLEIKRLLYDQGYTIEGARKELTKDVTAGQSQKELFKSRKDGVPLSVIRKELQGILTMLSRKC